MANHLADATSPYLLQHANNPVDWHPWNEAALRQAQAEQKPIFLSIGYSACHWCHVMAHESFEDTQIAAILNERFVSIKVDREERPDLDRIYMAAVQAMTGGGGWPMSVFLTPDGYPFYGGTYFPPISRYGLPSFTQVLQAVSEAWQNRRQEVVDSSMRLTEAIEHHHLVLPDMHHSEAQRDNLQHDTLHAVFQILWQMFDHAHGGWNGAPKFPQPMILEFLLRYHHATGAADALGMVTNTLEAMARGGIYDQLGGGFHRYSVDERWLTPHFERMLYDEAQLARVYLHAWQATQAPLHRAVTEEILDYVMREMTNPAGGFYSTQDADSEGEEGKFFLWTPAEIHDELGVEALAFMQAYGVTANGNFEGKNILTFAGGLDQRSEFARARQKLFEARQQRVHPGRDEKVLTAWNGLMLAAFGEAARVLDRPDYYEVAERNARFLMGELRRPDGRLLRSWKDGQANLNSYLEDHSCLIEGLIELYYTTFDPQWYQAAMELAEIMLAHFYTRGSGFFGTSDDHEKLITRHRDLQDNATPSGAAMAATTLLRLARLANRTDYVNIARDAITEVQPAASRYPLAFGQWLQAALSSLSPSTEVIVAGNPEAQDTQALLAIARSGFQPFQIVALAVPEPASIAVPLLEGHGMTDQKATAYVCKDSTCQPPVTSPEMLQALLGKP